MGTTESERKERKRNERRDDGMNCNEPERVDMVNASEYVSFGWQLSKGVLRGRSP